MDSFSITLPNEKAASYRIVTMIIALLNVLVFGYVFLNTGDERFKNLLLAGVIINMGGLVFFLLNNYSRFKTSFRIEIIFVLSAILWCIAGKYIAGLLLVFFALMGFYTNRPLIIHFSNAGILYPSFPRGLILWKEVAQVILKDDMLTIDLKNNKLIQVVVTKDNTAFKQDDFNSFCRSMYSSQ